jgi:hypothetical protein
MDPKISVKGYAVALRSLGVAKVTISPEPRGVEAAWPILRPGRFIGNHYESCRGRSFVRNLSTLFGLAMLVVCSKRAHIGAEEFGNSCRADPSADPNGSYPQGVICRTAQICSAAMRR